MLRLKNDMKQVGYTPKYTAFIDILGFTDLVKKTEKDKTLFENVLKALRYSRNIPIFKKGGVSFGIRKTIFSDCIVISAPINFDGLII